MDRTVPPGAALLLAYIYEIETSRKPPECYEVIYGHNQGKLPKPLTSMNLGDVIDAQASWTKRFKSSAAGAPQFMRATLIDLSKELHLRGNQVFDADLQDRLAYHLLKRRGYEEFIAGKISRTEFGKRLAMEWASFPVLAATKGAHRQLSRGQSYYSGDPLNKALVSPAKVEAVLNKVKVAGTAAPAPLAAVAAPAQPVTRKEAAKSVTKSKRFWTWLATGAATPLAAFGALDWRVQLALVAVVVGFAIYAISAMPQVRKALGLS